MLNVVQTPTHSFDLGETWMPLCLPHFNSSGFMHAHVTYLSEPDGLHLLLLSNKQDAFAALSACRTNIMQVTHSPAATQPAVVSVSRMIASNMPGNRE